LRDKGAIANIILMTHVCPNKLGLRTKRVQFSRKFSAFLFPAAGHNDLRIFMCKGDSSGPANARQSSRDQYNLF
jgi:hypothetical protein